MEYYITPIKSYTDNYGNWWIEFKEKELKKLFKKYQYDTTNRRR